MILEAGYAASRIDTYGRTILPALARRTRMCTATGRVMVAAMPGRPRCAPSGVTQAREPRTLLEVIHVGPPYVLSGHSYGGVITRVFAALYRGEVAGIVLTGASSEPEVGTVQPAPNHWINTHATVRDSSECLAWAGSASRCSGASGGEAQQARQDAQLEDPDHRPERGVCHGFLRSTLTTNGE